MYTYKTSLWLIRRLGGEWAPAKTTGRKTTLQQIKHPQNRHETTTRTKKDMRKMITTSERVGIIGQRSHCANFFSRWLPGWTDGRRTTTQKFARPVPATRESSRARSFARSHARTQRKRKRNRNRFPGWGVGLKPLSSPPTSNFVRFSAQERQKCPILRGFPHRERQKCRILQFFVQGVPQKYVLCKVFQAKVLDL